jgi:hypothetical protein
MRYSIWAASAAALALSGCTSFSFAPPAIETNRLVTDVSSTDCSVTADADATPINRNIEGALLLTDNFLAGYRCAARQAADGRQSFEIPSFLSLALAAAGGPAFNLSENEQLRAGLYSAVMGRANTYYAPAEKAGMLHAAIDGVVCVKNAAVGFERFNEIVEQENQQRRAFVGAQSEEQRLSELIEAHIERLKEQLASPLLAVADQPRLTAELNELLSIQTDLLRTMNRKVQSGSVSIEAPRAYYELVTGALYSIERVLSERLSDAGSFEPSGITTELEQYIQAQADARERQRQAENRGTNGAVGNYLSLQDKQASLMEIELDDLHAGLQKCVVRAKIG